MTNSELTTFLNEANSAGLIYRIYAGKKGCRCGCIGTYIYEKFNRRINKFISLFDIYELTVYFEQNCIDLTSVIENKTITIHFDNKLQISDHFPTKQNN